MSESVASVRYWSLRADLTIDLSVVILGMICSADGGSHDRVCCGQLNDFGLITSCANLYPVSLIVEELNSAETWREIDFV